MMRKNIEQTQTKQNRSKSKTINQSSSGRKTLLQTNKCLNKKIVFNTSQNKDVLLNRSISPKNKNRVQVPQIKNKGQGIQKKVKINDLKIKSVQKKQKQNQSQEMLKISSIDIECPVQDDMNDDQMILLCNSNYPKRQPNNFIRTTNFTNDLSKTINVKKNQSNLQNKQLIKTKTQSSTNNLKKDSSKDKKLQSIQAKASLQKSKRKIQKTVQPIKIRESQIPNAKKRTLSKTKIESKQKSSSTEKKRKISDKNKQAPTKSTKNIIPKLIPKPRNQKIKQKQISQHKNIKTFNKTSEHQQPQSIASPSFEQLQNLRQQNQKYKFFLASSAFKLQKLRIEIEENKQIRENQKNLYKFQLDNLKKQLDCNKRQVGHLFSYDDPQTVKQLIPDQIIIETDNEGSSVQQSLQIFNHKSKLIGLDENSQNNSQKINEQKKSIQYSSSFLNGKIMLSSQIQENINCLKNDLKKQEEFNSQFLSHIQKIPSLEVKLSIEQTQKQSQSSQNQKQFDVVQDNENKRKYKNQNNFSFFKSDESASGLLLLNSVGK